MSLIIPIKNCENVADLVECVVGSANLVTEALDVNLEL